MHTLSSAKASRQTGGITILVVLMLLVLLTIAAVGMSRNSFREAVISGTARQGSMVRNVGDSGIEWSLFWIFAENTTAPTATATGLKNLKTYLGQNPSLAGSPYDPSTLGPYNTVNPPAAPADLALPQETSSAGTVTTLGYSIALTRMGKLAVANTSQTADSSGFQPARGGENKPAPDLWAVRSDARVSIGSGSFAPTFIHAKEAWISTPAGN
jgi:Tfp pilus assembly protein PilX